MTGAEPDGAALRAVVSATHPGGVEVLPLFGDQPQPAATPMLAENPKGLHLVVGDRVELEGAGNADEVTRVTARRERRSSLVRSNPKRPEQLRVLAANVDLAIIVCAVNHPPFRPGLVDRMAIAARYGGVEPVLVINKIDLEHDPAALARELDPFVQSGMPLFQVSVREASGIDELRAAIEGNTVVLVGHSGVGKSSLANLLEPGRSRSTGNVRDYDGKGRHTTTRPQLSVLENGLILIDTPGIRSFGLAPIQPEELGQFFPEFVEAAEQCRFRSCQHRAEPGCAVREAAKTGTLSESRYRSYLRLYTELSSGADS